jgi:hypothetical protein
MVVPSLLVNVEVDVAFCFSIEARLKSEDQPTAAHWNNGWLRRRWGIAVLALCWRLRDAKDKTRNRDLAGGMRWLGSVRWSIASSIIRRGHIGLRSLLGSLARKIRLLPRGQHDPALRAPILRQIALGLI